MTKNTRHNWGLAKIVAQSSADRFVINQSLVLLHNIWFRNRKLLVAGNPYAQTLKSQPLYKNENVLEKLTSSFGLSLNINNTKL